MTRVRVDDTAPDPCHLPIDAWCGDRPAQLCAYERLGAFPDDAGDRDRHWQNLGTINAHYSDACPDSEALSQLISLGPIVELGAGNGYWAKLIRDRGGDVIAYDREPWEHPWSDVLIGDETALASHTDRALLFVMPYRPNGFGKVLRAWPGQQFAVVARSEFPFAISENNPEAFEDEMRAIEEGAWSREWERDLPRFGNVRVVFSLWRR